VVQCDVKATEYLVLNFCSTRNMSLSGHESILSSEFVLYSKTGKVRIYKRISFLIHVEQDKDHCRVHKTSPDESSWIVDILATSFIKINFNIIFPSRSTAPKWRLSCRLS
jgi:hypothetical protein